MSYPVSRREQVISVQPGYPVHFPLGCDYVYFHTIPNGISVKLNGEAESLFLQGETHQAEPGSGEIHSVTFLNVTGGALSVRLVFGLGRMTVAGVATLTGAIPLPTNASTASSQAALLAAVATAAKQDTSNTSLASVDAKLPAAAVRTGRVFNMASNQGFTFADCKRLSVLNTADVGSVTVTIAGNSGTLGAGQGCDFAVDNPADKLADILILTSASSTALVVFTK